MKKSILSIILFTTIAGFATAQTTKNKNSKTTSYTSTTSHKAKKPVRKKVNRARIETTDNSATIPDNRKEYMKDGQLATRTGHEAAPTNGEQFQGLKDTANKKKRKQ